MEIRECKWPRLGESGCIDGERRGGKRSYWERERCW